MFLRIAKMDEKKKQCVVILGVVWTPGVRGGEGSTAPRPVNPADKEDLSGTGFIEFGELLKYKSGPNIAVNIIKSPQRGVARVPGPH